MRTLVSALLVCNLVASLAFASYRPLSDHERESLRYRLQNLWSEVDLTIRNQRVNALDVSRQERDLTQMQVFQKIPMDSTAADRDFRAAVAAGITQAGLKLKEFRWTSRGASHARPALPSALTSDSLFSFKETQLVRVLRAQVVVHGTAEELARWVETWADIAGPDESPHGPLSPYIEWDHGPPPPKGATGATAQDWRVAIRSYRYLNVEYPNYAPAPPASSCRRPRARTGKNSRIVSPSSRSS